MPNDASWESYEQLARKVILDLKREFGISDVEGKQLLEGESGVTWEVDGKANLAGRCGFLVIEARRHTTSRQKQENLAALAYRIDDISGAGGIIVTPLPLQKGAVTLAAHENIFHIIISEDSTPENYVAQFLKKIFHHATAKSGFVLGDCVTATVI